MFFQHLISGRDVPKMLQKHDTDERTQDNRTLATVHLQKYKADVHVE